MTAQTILPANSVTASGYDVANSLRFNKGSADYIIRTFGTATNRRKWTLSMWTKRSSTAQAMLYSTSSASSYYQFQSGGQLEINDVPGSSYNYRLVTNTTYNNINWMHIVIAFDSTQGTDSNRIKLYVNGAQPALGTATYPSQNFQPAVNNAEAQKFGTYDTSTDYSYDGYFSELTFIDGQQLAPTSFGEENADGDWIPSDPSDLTFGNNGFYLEFKQSGTGTNASGMGADTSGNTNHFAVNNLTGIDQTGDTPSNNAATWNGLLSSNGAVTEGNLKYTTSNSGSNYGYRLSSIGVNKGKWYAEIKCTSSSVQGLIGIRSREATAVVHYIGYYNDDYAIYTDGSIFQANTDRGDQGASWGDDDIIGVYLDCDNNKLYFSKNGTLYTSTGYSITAAASTTSGNYFFGATEWNSGGNGTFELNVGNPTFAISSSNTDDNGYGNFEYSPNITGDSVAKKFYALNAKNVAEFG